MNAAEIIDLARNEFLDDAQEPYLWSNNTLELYLNEAEREACRRASLLIDKETSQDSDSIPLCSLDVVAGTSIYTVSQKIVLVKDLFLASNGLPLEQKTEDWLDDQYPYWRTSEGTPAYYIQRKGKVEIVPTPEENDTATLVVQRLPLEDVTYAGGETPEVPAEYHIDLIPWILHLAYRKQDAEAEDPVKAADNERLFRAKFGPSVSALTEKNRRRRPRGMRLRPKELGF
jgi:hypothetical protein